VPVNHQWRRAFLFPQEDRAEIHGARFLLLPNKNVRNVVMTLQRLCITGDTIML
jgi:hypothetical protein